MEQAPKPKKNKRLMKDYSDVSNSIETDPLISYGLRSDNDGLTSEELDKLIFNELHTGYPSLITNKMLDYFYRNNIKSIGDYIRCISRDIHIKSITMSKPAWFDLMIHTINEKTSMLTGKQKLIPSV